LRLDGLLQLAGGDCFIAGKFQVVHINLLSQKARARGKAAKRRDE
jgi:hypothetical protein